MPTFRFAMRDKLSREGTPQNFETIENELERLWAALKAVNDSIGEGGDGSVDLSDYVQGPTPAVSVANEIALWADTSGRLLKRSTGTGFVRLTSGVVSVQPAIDLNTDVTGLLPLSNLDLDGDATHVLFGDGTLRALERDDISDFPHRLLSAEHSDTEPELAEAGAIIVGRASGETIAAEAYWFDGQPAPAVSSLVDIGGNEFWIDGEPLAAIGFSSAGQWTKLDPPPHGDMILLWNGVDFEWIDYP